MHIISRSTLREFWEQYKDAEQPLKSWYHEAKNSKWGNAHEVKSLYRTCSVLKSGKIVFNIAGNKYRLVVMINYKSKSVYILFIGTHKEYDKINVEKL